VSFRVTGVGDSGPLRSSAAREAVVRPLSRAAERSCVRPGCPAPAQASLTFRYASREAWIERLTPEPSPEAYDLCSSHAARTQPPHGWQLRDRRPREEQLPQPEVPTRRDLGGEDTVAVLAAALRAVPEVTPPLQTSDAPEAAEPSPGRGADEDEEPVSSQVAADAGGTEAALEEAASPVLESPGVPRLFAPPAISREGAEEQAGGEDARPQRSEPRPGPDTPSGEEETDRDSVAVAGEPDGDGPGERSDDARPVSPRPVPAARARGIAPPANRSVQAPHGTALDW
jgi:hypothetical protein